MKRIAFMVMLSISTALVYAQKNSVRIGFGYQRTWMVDRQASPLKYRTGEKTIMLHYDHTGNNGILFGRIEGAMGKLFPSDINRRWWYDQGYNNDGTPKNDSVLMMGKLYNARIQLGYLKAIGSDHAGNKISSGNYAGGSINNQLFYTDNVVRNGWLNAASLNADYLHTISISHRHYIGLKISIPLLARNARLPYHNTISSATSDSNIKTFFKEGSRWAWLADFQDIQITAQYEYSINKNLGIGVYYWGQWLHYSHERPVTMLQNNLSVFASVK